jgi:hypothetical protein
MELIDDLRTIERMDNFIRLKATGTPDDLAGRFDISTRSIERLIADMRNMGLPILYDKDRKTYYYEEEVKIRFEIVVGKDNLLRIRGGENNNFENFFRPPDFGGEERGRPL